jgi:F-type H+-transporting ATPase subunit epsilon
MAATFQLSVLTPTQTRLDEAVSSITVPGSEGYLGVLAHHAPLITAIVPGRFTVTDGEGREREFVVTGGFLEVSNNRAILLADALEERSEIDVDRARDAEKRARKRIEEGAPKWDVERAEAALRRALTRQKVATGS